MDIFSRYTTLKQRLKPYIPHVVFDMGINFFHLIETYVAMVITGLPQRKLKFIGITGTNGKTTTALFLNEILEAEKLRTGLSTSAIIKIGEHVTLNETNMTTTNPFVLYRQLKQMANAGTEWVILEVASHALAQHRVKGINFDVVGFTNLSHDHLDYHHSMKEYAAIKSRLFRGSPAVMALNTDDEWYDYFNQFFAVQKIRYGADKDADVCIEQATLSQRGTYLRLALDEYVMSVALKLPGRFNAYNALAAAGMAYGMDISLESIEKGLESLENAPGRLQKVDLGQDFTVFVDYAHSPDGLRKVFESLRQINKKGRLIAVFGATGRRDASKRPLMGEIASELCDIVIITDDEPYNEAPAAIRRDILDGTKVSSAKILEVADRQKAIEKAIALAKTNDTVVLCGMGHLQYRNIGGLKQAWDEAAVATLAIDDSLTK